jgi:DNA-binding NarL/FixJ family response regulator
MNPPAPRARPAVALEILIVEDHPMMIRSITASLDVLHPQAQAGRRVVIVGSLLQAKRCLLRSELPALIVTDLHLPDSRGLDTLRALLAWAPGIPIVVFSACDDKSTGQAALALGARAFVSKSALPQDFAQEIKPFLAAAEARAGLAAQDPAVAASAHAAHPIASLTERQRQVLAEAASGYRDREIALRLKIGDQTVRSHLNVIFQRLRVQNRTQASRQYMEWARAHGLLA